MKKKSSGADDVESDDDSEDEDAGLPDADTSAATEVKDASVPGADKPKTEIAGLASLRSLFEGTQNDPPMPVDYLRGVNSKCVRTLCFTAHTNVDPTAGKLCFSSVLIHSLLSSG